MQPKSYFLPVIVFSQFTGTSLWFAGNAIIHEIEQEAGATSVAHLTSLVQFGFIAGTLVFAILTIADRFKPSVVFFASSVVAATANAMIIFVYDEVFLVSVFRFLTGFFLAGIYPVGMKIAADWYPKKLGNALGFLVGALVLGTAFPHILSSQLYSLAWKDVLLCTSALAVAGGLLVVLLIPSKRSISAASFEPSAFLWLFRGRNFRSAALGYFGHMWELYTFWAFLPLILQTFPETLHIPFWSFLIIATGTLGCIAGGLISKYKGSKAVALASLTVSGACCIFLPFSDVLSPAFYLAFMVIWGISVVADSPQFSTLVAQSAPENYKGTALTIVTSIGFAITIVSMQLTEPFFAQTNRGSWILAVGPVLGVAALSRWSKEKQLT